MISGEKSGLTKVEMYEQAQSVLDEFTERMSMQGSDNYFHGG